MQAHPIISLLRKYAATFYPVVPFSAGKDHCLQLNLTEANTALTESVYGNLQVFDAYIQQQLQQTGSRYAIGGYGELRVIYNASAHFNTAAEPRRWHLGMDIWGPAGTPVFAFMGGRVHSFAYNADAGDYGATLVLLHQLDGFAFHTLYGHISMDDINQLTASQYMVRGQQVARFGRAEENGGWPPHLHFQLIIDMELKQGDYPGVCSYSEKDRYLRNCPDPDLVLQMNRYTGNRP